MTDYRFLPLSRLLRDVSARRSVPGGGAVAAYAGALAVSCVRMAIAYSVDRRSPANNGGELPSVDIELIRHQAALLDLAVADQAAFAQMQAAGQSSDPALREGAAEAAARVPLQTAVHCQQAALVCRQIRQLVKPGLMSDVDVAELILTASARAAMVNVRVNLPATPAGWAARVSDELGKLELNAPDQPPSDESARGTVA